MRSGVRVSMNATILICSFILALLGGCQSSGNLAHRIHVYPICKRTGHHAENHTRKSDFVFVFLNRNQLY